MVEPPKVTITEFVTENDKVLTAIGVFVALSAFSLTLPQRNLSVSIAFASLLATFPLIFELMTKFLNRKWKISLIIFTNICGILWFRLALYVLLAFRDEWLTEMPKVVFWLIVLPIYGLYKRGIRNWIDPPVNWILSRFERYAIDSVVIAQSHIREILQLRIQLWRLRSNPSAFGKARRLVRNRRMSRQIDSAFREQSLIDWREKPNESPKWLIRGLLLLIPLVVFASAIQDPVARFINISLDIEAERYQVAPPGEELIIPMVPPVDDLDPIPSPTPSSE